MTEDTTRTTDGKDGDAAADTPTTDTARGDERTEPKGEYHERQALENKVKAERLNALMERYGVSTPEELEQALAQSPAATSRPEPAPNAEPAGEPAHRRQIRDWAAKGDPYAIAQVEAWEREQQLITAISEANMLRDISDITERNEVTRHVLAARQRGRNLDVNAARAEVREKKLAAENEKLKARLQQMDKKPDPDVVNAPKTGGREGAAKPSNARKMSGAEFDAENARLPMHEALKLQHQLAAGEIIITD